MKAFLAAFEFAQDGRPSVSISYQKPISRKEHKPHAFPADEEHQVRVAADEDHHHGDEQVQEDEEARVASFVMFEAHILVHVADGVDVDQRPDARDDQHHRGRERVDAEGPVEVERADVDPLRQPPAHHFAVIDRD